MLLKHGRLSLAQVRAGALFRNQPSDADERLGYEVYAVNCTEHRYPEAETLPDQKQRKGDMGRR